MDVTRLLLVGIMAIGFTVSAQASPITFDIDTVGPNSNINLSKDGDDHLFYHTLGGYDLDTDTLTAGTLTLYFLSGADRPPWTTGRFSVTLGEIPVFNGNFAPSVIIDLTGDQLGAITISDAGQVAVLLTRTNAAGIAIFDESTLSVSGTREAVSNGSGAGSGNGVVVRNNNPAAVPEPGTLALFAAGLAGVGAFRRRRRLA